MSWCYTAEVVACRAVENLVWDQDAGRQAEELLVVRGLVQAELPQ